MTTPEWRHSLAGTVALVDHDYEVESGQESSEGSWRRSPGHSSLGTEGTGSSSSEGGSEAGEAEELIDVVTSPDEYSPPPPPVVEAKRRRVNSEPAGAALMPTNTTVTGHHRTGLAAVLSGLGVSDGRGRKPRAASTQSESDAAIVNLRDRKKEQNKDAAKRYRQRKKSDRYVLDFELQQEASRNAALSKEIDSLTQQINCLKRCLRDAAGGGGVGCGPRGGGARDSPLGILAEVATAQISEESEVVLDVVTPEEEKKVGMTTVKTEACGRVLGTPAISTATSLQA